MTRHRSSKLRLALPATATALLLTALAAAPAAGQDRELYVGFHFGVTAIDVDRSEAFDQVLDGDENSQTYEVGFKFSRYFAVEAAYHDFSDVDGAIRPCAEGVNCADIPIQGKISAVSVAVIPQVAITGRVAVFAKVGLVSWDANVEDAADDLDIVLEDTDDEDLIYGVGVEFQLLGRLKLVGRWESIAGDIETLSVGARFGF